MRVYRETMPGTTDCVHCVKTWFPSKRDENKGRLGWSCELSDHRRPWLAPVQGQPQGGT